MNFPLILYVVSAGLKLEQVNSPAPGCVQLLCTIGTTGQEQVLFIWTVRGQNESKEGQISNSSFTASSSLHLCGPEWSSGDTITCSTAQPSGHLTSKLIIDGQNSFEQNTGVKGKQFEHELHILNVLHSRLPKTVGLIMSERANGR